MSKIRQELTVIWTRVVTGEMLRNDWILDIVELTAFASRLDVGV